MTCIKEHFASLGKVKIYKEEYESAKALLEGLQTHMFTKHYFITEDNCEIKHQVPLLFDKYKALLDGILINHNLKTIEPYDLKTSEDSALGFPDKFFKFRYDLQAAIYTEAVKVYKDTYYPDYELLDFKFVVGSFNYPNKPLVYNAKNILDIGKNGGEYKGKYYKGYLQLTQEYFWHKEYDKWDYRKEVYDQKGVINL